MFIFCNYISLLRLFIVSGGFKLPSQARGIYRKQCMHVIQHISISFKSASLLNVVSLHVSELYLLLLMLTFQLLVLHIKSIYSETHGGFIVKYSQEMQHTWMCHCGICLRRWSDLLRECLFQYEMHLLLTWYFDHHDNIIQEENCDDKKTLMVLEDLGAQVYHMSLDQSNTGQRQK